MDEALQIQGSILGGDRFAGQVEFDDILASHQFGRQRARDEEAVGTVRMAHAHMAIGVDHVFLRQRAVRDHQVTDELVEIGRIHAHYSPPWVRSASTSSANANRHSIPPNVPKSARIWLPGEHSIGRMNDPDNTVCPASMRPPYRARRSTSHDTERAGSPNTPADRKSTRLNSSH